jgi:hypothetical protein
MAIAQGSSIFLVIVRLGFVQLGCGQYCVTEPLGLK